MFCAARRQPARSPASAPSARQRHRRRWLLAAVVTVGGLVVAVARVYLNQLDAPPLELPRAASVTPAGSVAGTWEIQPGSVAGFRIQQTVLFMSGDVVGRTDEVAGTLAASAEEVTHVALTVDLSSITSGGRSQPQFAISLDTADHPSATFTLTGPVTLPAGFATGRTVTTTATGQLTLRGQREQVTFDVSGRWDGPTIQFLGTIPIALADWGIEGPTGYGPLGSVADHGSAEFLVVLRRS